MGNSVASEQQQNIQPPRAGQTLAIVLDNTARSYDLTSLDTGGVIPEADTDRRIEVFVTIQAETAGAYLSFSNVARTVNEASAVAAGGTLAYDNTACAKLELGAAAVRYRLNRSLDKFLNVKGTGAGVLRLWVSSEAR